VFTGGEIGAMEKFQNYFQKSFCNPRRNACSNDKTSRQA
jgi:hypothetical protein